MKLAIMQPYLFPYIGYFQLINAVDKFVIYDDVAYIKQGWINRNRILLGEKPFLFTVPVARASSSKKIKDILLNDKTFSKWRMRFYKTIEIAYKKAPFYEDVSALIRNVLDKEVKSIAELCRNSIVKIIAYLGIQTEIIASSTVYQNDNLKSSQRVIDICLNENAVSYINAPGGSSLYNKKDFSEHNVNLQFLVSGSIFYRQFENDYIPALSIIDVMMFNSADVIMSMLRNYTLE